MNLELENYKKLKPQLVIDTQKNLPKTFFPLPTEEDYKLGYINRYFIQKRGDEKSPIFEVNRLRYGSVIFPYKGVTIKWYITGDLKDKWVEKIYYPSVIKLNNKEIESVKAEMPELKLYLVNLKQFWKPM